MVLKPLNNDDIEDSGSDQWGFYGPFYQGVPTLFKNFVKCLYFQLYSVLSQYFVSITRFQAKIL